MAEVLSLSHIYAKIVHEVVLKNLFPHTRVVLFMILLFASTFKCVGEVIKTGDGLFFILSLIYIFQIILEYLELIFENYQTYALP